MKSLGVDKKAAKRPDFQILALALFKAELIGSYIALQGLVIQEIKGQQIQKQEVKD